MVQLSNLQALVARRTLKRFYAVLLFRLSDAAISRNLLQWLVPRVLAGDTEDVKGTPLLNVFISWIAVSKLLAGNSNLDSTIGKRQLEPFFTDPDAAPDSASLADQLGFVGPSAPQNWWAGFLSSDIDLAIYIGCDDETERRALIEKIRAEATGRGVVELLIPSFADGAVSGYLPPGGRLHFGFRDGITTPDVDWSDNGRPGAVNFREFVLGYWTQDYPVSPFAEGPWRDFVRDGSFACLAWIHQNVAQFEQFLLSYDPQKGAALAGIDTKEWLAARLMGRWRDGSPLSRYPNRPPATPDLDNDFGYSTDPDGLNCPLDSHIRVAFSRDQPLKFANAARFPNGPPRLLRRGFSYGPPLSGPTDDGLDRGLFGIFLCARINEQFYTVLRWMQQTDFSDAFSGKAPGRAGQDRVMGSRLAGGGNTRPDTEATEVIGGKISKISLLPFIRYRGVKPLFVPSIPSLRVLAQI